MARFTLFIAASLLLLVAPADARRRSAAPAPEPSPLESLENIAFATSHMDVRTYNIDADRYRYWVRSELDIVFGPAATTHYSVDGKRLRMTTWTQSDPVHASALERAGLASVTVYDTPNSIRIVIEPADQKTRFAAR